MRLEHIGVYGPTMCGKTTLVKSRIKAFERVVIFDPQGEYPGRGYRSLKALIKYLKRVGNKPFRVRFQPPGLETVATLHLLSQLLFPIAKAIGGLVFVVDELHRGFPSQGLKSEFKGFARLCTEGRHVGISLIGVTQRPASVHPIFRDNLTRVVCFRLFNERALMTIRNEWHSDIVKEIKQLPRFHALEINNQGEAKKISSKP